MMWGCRLLQSSWKRFTAEFPSPWRLERPQLDQPHDLKSEVKSDKHEQRPMKWASSAFTIFWHKVWLQRCRLQKLDVIWALFFWGMHKNLAVMSSWDGTAEVYPYKPSSSTQQQNEERETLLENRSERGLPLSDLLGQTVSFFRRSTLREKQGTRWSGIVQKLGGSRFQQQHSSAPILEQRAK
jgi:hypothetical protein